MRESLVFAVVAVIVGCKSGTAPAAGKSESAVGAGSAMVVAGSAQLPAAASPSPPPSPPSGKPLKEVLAGAAAKPVLLALDAKGQLIARTVDAGYTAVVLSGPYSHALHDVALDLVWLLRDTGLDVLDLRVPGPPKPTVIVTAPDKVLENLGEHIRRPPHWTMADWFVLDLATSCHKSAGVAFEWAKGGVGTTRGTESAKVVAKDWLAAQEHRVQREPPPAFTKKLAKRYKVPKRVGTCTVDVEDEFGKGACGTGLAFGTTGRELVIVSANPDKCPAKQCRSYDKTTKQYANVPGLDPEIEDAATCGPFLFEAGGATYLVDDKACTGENCTSVGKQAVGWLDGARVLDAN